MFCFYPLQVVALQCSSSYPLQASIKCTFQNALLFSFVVGRLRVGVRAERGRFVLLFSLTSTPGSRERRRSLLAAVSKCVAPLLATSARTLCDLGRDVLSVGH